MTKLTTAANSAGHINPPDNVSDHGATARDSNAGALLCFLQGFLANPGDVASVIPSSRFLRRRLRSLSCIQAADAVVELGPGTGSTTQALLGGMRRQSRLLCIELVPEFAAHLRRISDDRMNVVAGSALDLQGHLQKYDMPAPDVIVSGIPFSTMPPDDGEQLVERIHAALAPGGRFIAYQVRDHVSQLANRYFGEPETSLVLWNIPPLRIYRWTKTSSQPRSIPR